MTSAWAMSWSPDGWFPEGAGLARSVGAAGGQVDPQSPWLWALAVVALGLLAAALIVLVRDRDLPPHRGLIWAVVLFALPLFGPGAYLGWEVLKRQQLRRDREADDAR